MPDLSEHPAVREMQKEIARLTKSVAASNERLAAERKKTLRTKLGELLGKAGITDPLRNKSAVTNLIADGRVEWSDSALVFNDDDFGAIDIETGLSAWSKTDHAKIYMTPEVAEGSGDGGGGRGPAGNAGKGHQRGAVARMLLDQVQIGASVVLGAQAPPTSSPATSSSSSRSSSTRSSPGKGYARGAFGDALAASTGGTSIVLGQKTGGR